MNAPNLQHPTLALVGCMLVMVLFGSVHSFSVFLEPLEMQLLVGRAEISLFYSFALIFLTISVLIGYRLYTFLTPAKMLGACCFIAALGITISSSVHSWWVVFLGYSVVFGSVNGIGYGYALQLSGKIFPTRKGFAMGSVTAAYGFGSIIFSFVYAALIAAGSVASALLSMAIILIVVGLVSVAMLGLSKVRYVNDDTVIPQEAVVDKKDKSNRRNGLDKPKIWHYWCGYFLSILSGLMVIGHAAALMKSYGASASVSFWGAVMVGVGSTMGGFLSGSLIDRWPVSLFLQGLPLLAGVSLLLLIFSSDISIAIILLCMIGFSYGSIITIYPVAISKDYGERLGPKVYGRIFTGWGIAGLLGPWMAGTVYDQFLDYDYGIGFAAFSAFLGTLVVRFSSMSDNKS